MDDIGLLSYAVLNKVLKNCLKLVNYAYTIMCYSIQPLDNTVKTNLGQDMYQYLPNFSYILSSAK